MVIFDLFRFQRDFRRNLAEWASGGPHERGWTRNGPVITVPDYQLDSVRREDLSVDEGLAKNVDNNRRWHLDFITHYGREWCETSYWKEYLLPRYGKEDCFERCRMFIHLFESIRDTGYRDGTKPVYIVDLGDDRLGFRYFRFDGCHRLTCAKALGIKTVPCLVFGVK